MYMYTEHNAIISTPPSLPQVPISPPQHESLKKLKKLSAKTDPVSVAFFTRTLPTSHSDSYLLLSPIRKSGCEVEQVAVTKPQLFHGQTPRFTAVPQLAQSFLIPLSDAAAVKHAVLTAVQAGRQVWCCSAQSMLTKALRCGVFSSEGTAVTAVNDVLLQLRVVDPLLHSWLLEPHVLKGDDQVGEGGGGVVLLDPTLFLSVFSLTSLCFSNAHESTPKHRS